MMGAEIEPVLITGAGPTGMTTALDLAHYGIPSILLDDDHQLSGGSRAIAFHRTALAVWEKLGAGQAILEKGIAWTVRHTFYKDKEVYTQAYPKPPDGLLPGFVDIQQYYVEKFLLDQIHGCPLIDLRWDHKVTGLRQDENGAVLNVETPEGSIQLTGRYVIACDGARSTLRQLLQLDFPGKTHKDRFLIADIRADLNLPAEPRFYFDHPANPGYTVLFHLQPDNVWRIDWQIGQVKDVETERSPEHMDARIRALIGDTPYEIVWLSDYRFHQRILDNFRHGRVFFAGDSAHLMAPFGARGLNSAVQDVENLVWKLAFVLKGLAGESLLDTYQGERHPAQTENQRVTGQTMLFMSPPNPWRRLLRNLILRLAAIYAPARRWVNSGRMSVPFIYKKTPLSLADDEPSREWTGSPALGEQPADAPVVLSENGGLQNTQLRKLLGSGFVLLYFVEKAEQALTFVQDVEAAEPHFPLMVYPVSTQSIPGRHILDPEGKLAHLFGGTPGSAYLIRPDRHLAARRHRANGSQMVEEVEALLAGK